jgi:hypothetical protein
MPKPRGKATASTLNSFKGLKKMVCVIQFTLAFSITLGRSSSMQAKQMPYGLLSLNNSAKEERTFRLRSLFLPR